MHCTCLLAMWSGAPNRAWSNINELLAAMDHHDGYIRTLAEELVTRSSSRPTY